MNSLLFGRNSLARSWSYWLEFSKTSMTSKNWKAVIWTRSIELAAITPVMISFCWFWRNFDWQIGINTITIFDFALSINCIRNVEWADIDHFALVFTEAIWIRYLKFVKNNQLTFDNCSITKIILPKKYV